MVKPAVRKPVAITRGENGKRTLSGEVDKPVTTKRRKTAEEVKAAEMVFDANDRSRFFGATSKHKSAPTTTESGSVQRERVAAPRPQHLKGINMEGEETLVVEQEAGYRSPSFSTAPFVSSPIKPTEDEPQSRMLETQVTTPAATGLGATLTLGVPETPIASRNSAGVVAGRPMYQLSIDLEQILSQGCEDAGVEETQLVSQGSSRADSSFADLDHHYDTPGHTTGGAETEDCGVSESEYGVPESDVEVVVPQEPLVDLIEAAEDLVDDEARARTGVIARGWRTRFTLAAVAGRSAPGEEKKVGMNFLMTLIPDKRAPQAAPQIRRRETNLSPIAARRRKVSAKAPLQSLNANVDPQSPSRHPFKGRMAKRPRHSEPTLPVSLNLVPDSHPLKRPRVVVPTEPTSDLSSYERLNAFRYDYKFLFFIVLPLAITLSDIIQFRQVMGVIVILQVTLLGIILLRFISATLRFTSRCMVALLDYV